MMGYYIHGSTKLIFTHTGAVVNRIEYDHLGRIRSQTAAPQVEMLWKHEYYNDELDMYICKNKIYDFTTGFGYGIRKSITGMIVFLPNLLNPISIFKLPILKTNALSLCQVRRGTDINKPENIDSRNPLLDDSGISISGGSQVGWNADSTEYYISPYMWYRHHLCCYAYEIDDDFNPTGRCAVWGDCTDGLY